jgi:pimeloyl-ACP methyl ester carboxylesterase
MNNFIDINNKKISYKKIGKGNPIIFLHGITSSSNTWDDVFKDISKIRTIYMIDLRGHGFSDHFNSYKWVEFSDDIKNFIDEIVGSSVDILGHSLGACVASHVAAMSPNYIRSIILEDPPFFHHRRAGKDGISKRFKYNLSLAKSYNSKEEILKIFRDNSKLSNVKNIENIASNLSNLDYKVLEDTIEGSALIGFNPEKIIKEISNVKTLLLVGNEKKTGDVIIKEEVDFIAKNLKNLSIKEFDCGHNIHEEKTEEFKDVVTNFLE